MRIQTYPAHAASLVQSRETCDQNCAGQAIVLLVPRRNRQVRLVGRERVSGRIAVGASSRLKHLTNRSIFDMSALFLTLFTVRLQHLKGYSLVCCGVKVSTIWCCGARKVAIAKFGLQSPALCMSVVPLIDVHFIGQCVFRKLAVTDGNSS